MLEVELAAMPADGALSIAWISYVPTPDDDRADPNPITRIRHRLPASHPRVRKVFFRADLMQRFEDVVLADGNHLLLSRKGRAIPERVSGDVHLAHYPVRTSAQIISKAVVGALARQVSPDFTDHQSRHWRKQIGDPAFVEGQSPEQLLLMAKSYLGEDGDSPLMDAPLVTGRKGLRYAHLIQVDPFVRLSRCIAALAAAGALRPVHGAAGSGGGRMISHPETEHRSLLAELDVTRLATQQLHHQIASMAAIVEQGRKPWRRERRKLLIIAGFLIGALLTLHGLR